jgi:hypothetical protein
MLLLWVEASRYGFTPDKHWCQTNGKVLLEGNCKRMLSHSKWQVKCDHSHHEAVGCNHDISSQTFIHDEQS